MVPAVGASSVVALPLSVVEEIGRVAFLVGYGAVLLAAIYVGFLKVQAVYAGGTSTDADLRVNCSSCGARTAADAEECSYCGESFDG